ncbi:MAG TPA: PPC domain-containing protein [Thermoanaerobaculia bacterium]|nr:PPC domain-containing protein [Thermoanaerobaculia bacterium]
MLLLFALAPVPLFSQEATADMADRGIDRELVLRKLDPDAMAEKVRRKLQLWRLESNRPLKRRAEGSVQPFGATCSLSSMSCNTTVSGNLGPPDCTLSDNTYLDFWTFSGTAGQQVTITLRSGSFDAYLVLVDPAINFVAEDDDSGGGNDARIVFTLTSTGTWTIVVNQAVPGTGSYTLNLVCTTGGTPPPSECSETTITCNRTLSGTFSNSDCTLSDGTFVDLFLFNATAQQRIVVTMRSTAVDSYLGLLDPSGEVFAEDDDSGGGNDARLDVTLGVAGVWTIIANQVSPATGAYTIELTCPTPQPPTGSCSPCAPSATTACLLANRFRVTVPSFRDLNANLSGQGSVIRYAENREEVHPNLGPLSAGTFFSLYSFAPASIEVLMRMISGVSINDHFWVFATGFTGAEYTLRVEDTQRNCRSWQRTIPAGATDVVKDFEAFSFP